MSWYNNAWIKRAQIGITSNAPFSLMTDSGTKNHAGQKIILVVSTAGFGVGRPVTIKDDLHTETGVIATLDSATEFTLVDNLANDYHVANNGVAYLGPITNYSAFFDAYYNCCPISADSCTQFHYRPAVRYSGTHDRTYIAGANAAGLITIRQWDEDDLTLSSPVTVFDFTAEAQDDHIGASVIVLQHQGNAADGTILVTGTKGFNGSGASTYMASVRSDNAEDITSWGAANVLAGTYQAVYPNVFETSGGTVYCISQEKDATGTRLDCYLRVLKIDPAEPDNDVWSARMLFADLGDSDWTYAKGWMDSDIHVAFHGLTGELPDSATYHDIWYAKITHFATGTADGNTVNKLIDSTTDFTVLGVAAEWYACNLHAATPTITKITGLDDDHTIALGSDAFPDGDEEYALFCVEGAAGGLKHLPLDKTNADHTPDVVLASDAGAHDAMWDIKTNSSHIPYILYFHHADGPAPGDSFDLYRAWWDGDSWETTDTTINGYAFPTTKDWPSGAEMDEGNPDVIYASVPDGSNKCQIQAWELVAGTWYIADGANGTTAIATDGKITQASPGHNFRPIHVLNGAGHFEILWFYSEYYDTNVIWEAMRFAYPGFNNQNFIGFGKGCRTDFEDVVFTNSDGTTLLGDEGHAWFQSETDSWRAALWIGKWTLPINGQSITLYAYYSHADNTFAPDQATMNAQFLAGDHFDEAYGEADFDALWTTVAEGTTAPTIADSSIVLTSTTSTRSEFKQNAANYPLFLFADIRMKWKASDTTPGAYYVVGTYESETGAERCTLIPGGSANAANDLFLWTVSDAVLTQTAVDDGNTANWHVWSIQWFDAILCKFYRDTNTTSTNRTPDLLWSTHTTNVSNEAQGLALKEGNTASTGSVSVEWIFARPITTEPTIVVSNLSYKPVTSMPGNF